MGFRNLRKGESKHWSSDGGAEGPDRSTRLLTMAAVGFLLFPFAFVVIYLARSDLRKMDAGELNPAARRRTQVAMGLGLAVVAVGVLGLVAAISANLAGVK